MNVLWCDLRRQFLQDSLLYLESGTPQQGWGKQLKLPSFPWEKNAFLMENTFPPLPVVLKSTVYSIYDSAFTFFVMQSLLTVMPFWRKGNFIQLQFLCIGVPFSGSGFNGVFLCVLFMWSSHLFSQSYKFSNKISLSWYFSLCITYLMIFITFFPLNPGSINFLYPSEYREFYWCFIARVSYCFNCDAPRHPWIMLKCY